MGAVAQIAIKGGIMLGPGGRVQTAPNASLSDRAALGARRVVSSRALAAAALLSLALGAALYEGLAGGRSSVAAVRDARRLALSCLLAEGSAQSSPGGAGAGLGGARGG